MQHQFNLEKFIEKLKANYNDNEFGVIIKAYDFAKNAHLGQKRASGEDYIVHPCSVAEILIDIGLDAETIVASLLHDVVEDTAVKIDEIKNLFGSNIVVLVNGVTKLDRINFTTKEEEQAENLRKMFFSMSEDIRVIIIKLADRLHNMRTLSYKSLEGQKIKAQETLEIYAPIAARLGISNLKCELEDLALRYMYPEVYYELVEKIASKREERHSFVDNVVESIKNKLEIMDINGEVNGRPKHFYSIYKKMASGKEFDQIYDLTAVRVIVDEDKDCYAVLGIIHTMWRPLPGRFKDYIASPKLNGYKSLHTSVVTEFGVPFEIQIRTKQMHKIAEYGIAAHWKYKEGADFEMNSDDKALSWIRQSIEMQKEEKDSKEFLSNIKLDLYTKEVFVFTPNGDVFNLPAGSTAIDFAYAVHTEVGNRCFGVKIDKKIAPLITVLKNGNMVEIQTSKSAKGPSRDWLNWVKTPSAKSKIKAYFKKQLKEENIKLGKEMLERECKHRGYVFADLILNKEWLVYVENRFGINTMDELYSSVVCNTMNTNGVLNKLIEFEKKAESQMIISEIKEIVAPKKILSRNSDNSVKVQGNEGVLIRLSQCCSPVPGDEIVGYVSKGRGVSIHLASCSNLINAEKARFTEVSWKSEYLNKFQANLNIDALNKHSLIAEIANVVTNMKLRVIKLMQKSSKEDSIIISLSVELDNIDVLKSLVNKLKTISGVYDVRRASGK